MATFDDLLSVLQGASNSAASNLSGPVDAINWALGKAGLPVSKKPIGGSEWLREIGFTAEPKNQNLGLLGEAVGGILPIVATAKAPQIAQGMNRMADNLNAPKSLNPQTGAVVWGSGPNDYRMTHKAPTPDFGAPLHDLTGGGQMYPADVYSPKAVQYYGTGYPSFDKEAFDLARRVRGNPDAEVVMYRAVPKGVKDINPGDWVSLSKGYAKNHGESVLENKYDILSKKVKAKELFTNADSIHEFGYNPIE